MGEFTSSRFTGPAGEATDVAVDGNTVTLTLDEPNPEFAIRPLADMPIMPEHVWADVTDPEAAGLDLAVGSGPYVLAEYNPDQGYTLEANNDWALGTPAVETLSLSIIPEPQTAIAALQSGEVDAVTDGVPPQVAEQLEGQDDLTVVSGPEFGSTLLNMNNGRAPFDDPDIRHAVSLAIDVDDLVQTVLLGEGTEGDPGFVHPESPYAQVSCGPGRPWRSLYQSPGATAGKSRPDCPSRTRLRAVAARLADRAPEPKQELSVPTGTTAPVALRRTYRVVHHDPALPPISGNRVPVDRPATILAHIATRPTAVSSWQALLDTLPDLIAAADPDEIGAEIAKRGHAAAARLSYLLDATTDIPLRDRFAVEKAGKVWFGPRGPLRRHDAARNIADTILPAASVEFR